jgi:hypothetical protein
MNDDELDRNIEIFEYLLQYGIKVFCTYCWQTHYAPSVDWWIVNGGCGKDRWRYFTDSVEYIRYVRQYTANGCQHAPLGEGVQKQLSLF